MSCRSRCFSPQADNKSFTCRIPVMSSILSEYTGKREWPLLMTNWRSFSMGVSPLTITASVRGTIISLATVSRKERILCIISPSSSLRSPSSSPTSMSCWISFWSSGCDVFLRCRNLRRVAIFRHKPVSGPSSKGLRISLCIGGSVFAPS